MLHYINLHNKYQANSPRKVSFLAEAVITENICSEVVAVKCTYLVS